MLDYDLWLRYAGEAVKIVGGLASFFAVVKLWQIEKKIPVQGDNSRGARESSVSA
jgi:hypothetical protein